jgi:hypothetical protein
MSRHWTVLNLGYVTPDRLKLLEPRKDRDGAVLQGTGGAGPAWSAHRSTLPAMMCSPVGQIDAAKRDQDA